MDPCGADSVAILRQLSIAGNVRFRALIVQIVVNSSIAFVGRKFLVGEAGLAQMRSQYQSEMLSEFEY
jgi:hypothetical protein